MLHRIVAAGLQDVVEAHHVGHDVGIGVGDAVAHAGLCCEIDHHGGAVFLKQAVDELTVGDVAPYECP